MRKSTIVAVVGIIVLLATSAFAGSFDTPIRRGPVASTGGTVSGPASVTQDNVTCWGEDNTALKDCGHSVTSAGWSILDDANAAAQRATLGLGPADNIATTGTLTGGIMILDNVASPSAAQSYGAWDEISGAGTRTLPPVATGMSICFGTSAAIEVTLELDNSDHFVLNGLTMSDGEAIINTTAEAAGDYICVIGLNATTWKIVGNQGVWTQATP